MRLNVRGNIITSLIGKSQYFWREKYKNVQILILDEYSMIDSDMLYQMDFRLKEIKNRPYEVFGGVAVVKFGDILQIKPVNGRYIFECPKILNGTKDMK